MEAQPVAYVFPGAPGFSNYIPFQYPNCDPKADAHALHKAFKGVGTDEKIVIQILSNRSKEQLDAINIEYKDQARSHHTLEQGLKSEISGNFLKLSLGLVTRTIIYKKDCLREAVEGLGTRDRVLIDVLSHSINFELTEIAMDSKLKSQILGDVSGDFKRSIEEILQARRPEFGVISPEQAEEIAHRFYKAGEGRLGTDDGEFIRIIMENSREALHQVDHVYQHKHKHGLYKAITKETSYNFKKMLHALIMPRTEYYAKRLHQAIKGAGTDEITLNYIFSVLDKGELKFVAEAYQQMYKKSLKEAISGDTSGNYRKLLLELLN